jgi:MFS family permease
MSANVRGGLIPFIVLYAALYAGFGMLSPFLPTLLEKRDLQPDQIGLVLALSTAVRLISGPVAGRFANAHDALRTVRDRVNHKKISEWLPAAGTTPPRNNVTPARPASGS